MAFASHVSSCFWVQRLPSRRLAAKTFLFHVTCMPRKQVGGYLVGGGPQQGVLLLGSKAAQHVADVVGAEHGGDPQAGGQQASQGALARAAGARQQHRHTAALFLDAAGQYTEEV